MTSANPIPVVSRFRCFADSRAMFRNPVQVLSSYNKIFGDTFRLYLGGLKEAIVTIDPAVIQHVLKTNAENYQKSEIQVKRMGHFLGKGLLTTHGEAWRTAAASHPKRLRSNATRSSVLNHAGLSRRFAAGFR